jgi:hypothetical protein
LTKTLLSAEKTVINQIKETDAFMKRALMTLILVLALVASLSAGMRSDEVVKANFFVGPAVWIQSPCNWLVYTNTSVPLNVVARVHEDAPEIVRFLYSVDENSNLTLTSLERVPDVDGYEFHVASVLENLAEGNHTLIVYSQDAHNGEMSASVEFIIDTDFKSPLSVLSPQNKTYFTTDIPLTFVCTEELRRTEEFTMADYVLDGMGAGYISGNETLTGLAMGEHELIVVVWTVKGVFNQTVYFSVSQPSSNPSPSPGTTTSPESTLKPEAFPTTSIIAVITSATVIGAGLLVYFNKRKH